MMKCIEVRAVQWPEIWKLHMGLLHYCTFRLETANDAQNVRIGTACRIDNDQQNLLQIVMWYRSIYIPNRFRCLKIPIIS